MRQDVEFVGISNSPSDYNARDGVMSHLVNLVPEDGELKVVGKGRLLWTVPPGYKLLYVHTVASEGKHYIFYKDNRLYYQVDPSGDDGSKSFKEVGAVASDPKLVSVGNTLIAYSQDEMRYFLWREDKETHEFGYKNLGTHLPETLLRFGLQSQGWANGWTAEERKDIPETLTHKEGFGLNRTSDEAERNLEQQICGIANQIISNNHKYGRFIFPFFVRYAYRLYDGTTLTMHSAPILMTPSTFEPMYFEFPELNSASDRPKEAKLQVNCVTCQLDCVVESDVDALSDYSDIIKSIDIFVSAPIYTYKQAGYDVIDDAHNYRLRWYDRTGAGTLQLNYGVYQSRPNDLYRVNRNQFQSTTKFYITLPKFTSDEIKKDAEDKSLFYLIKSIEAGTLADYKSAKVIDIEKGYLQSLVNKEVMTDDYNSHDVMTASSMYVYNNRLNAGDIKRRFFCGWAPRFAQHYDVSDNYMSVWYELHNTAGVYVVTPGEARQTHTLGLYTYYPSTAATKAIFRLRNNDNSADSGRYLELPMRQHKFLNGSFALIPFWDQSCRWDDNDLFWADAQEGDEPELKGGTYAEPNKIYTSEVNMPFYFPVTGINTVGLGHILGMGTTTQALSQGQFGQYPLYAFTDEGIWALQMSSTGAISSVTPVSRDVVNHPESITQTDDAILFSSDRGLMLLQGSQTTCLSDALDGVWLDPTTLRGWSQIADGIDLGFGDFKSMLKQSSIIYDYARQRIMVCPPTSTVALVFSLRSSQWGQSSIGVVLNTCNSYPNNVVQIPSAGKKAMTDIVDVSKESNEKVKVLAVSRPIAFGDRNGFKTVNTMIARGDAVSLALYGSRDHIKWGLVGSAKGVYLRGIQGSPYKTFKAVLVGSLRPGQHVTGLSFELTPKDDDKLR